jgi:hypothetical protein
MKKCVKASNITEVAMSIEPGTYCCYQVRKAHRNTRAATCGCQNALSDYF